MPNQLFMNTFTTKSGTRVVFSSELEASVYENNGQWFARITFNDIVGIGTTQDFAVEDMITQFKRSVETHLVAGDLQDVLMKYGWSYESRDDKKIVCIEPPVKVTIFKSDDRLLLPDDLDHDDFIESQDDIDDLFKEVFGYVPKLETAN